MLDSLIAFGHYVWLSLADAIFALIIPTIFFVMLALIMKRREALAAAKRAAHEVRLNLSFYFLDALFVVPVLGVLTVAIAAFMQANGLVVVPAAVWATLGTYPTLFLAVFLGDFIGYWRHRLEHTRWLWPTHAIHHSDEEMTWLTLNRFHPINRITTTLIDSAFLVAMGLPAWAAIANSLVRNYYGYFIHADLPWTYGPLARCSCPRRCINGITPRTSNTRVRTLRPCSRSSIAYSARSHCPDRAPCRSASPRTSGTT